MIAVLIPIKEPTRSKQRLGELLNPEERRRLALAMLTDVVGAAAGAGRVGRVVVLGGGEGARRIADSRGCEFWPEPDNPGETEAVAAGTGRLADGASGLLVLPADIPLVRSEDIDVLVAQSGVAPGVVLCPSRDRLGTNAALRCPAGVMPLTFGNNSFEPHRKLAARLGVPCTVIELPRVGLDLDRPEDVAAYLAEAVDGESYRYLNSIGVKERLGGPGSPVGQRTDNGSVSSRSHRS